MTEIRRNIVDAPENESIMDIKQLNTQSDMDTISELRSHWDELQQMDLSLTEGIKFIDSSKDNLDSEIKSFDLLDRFLNDPLGFSKIDQYINELNEIIENVELNAVTSSIALSTIGTFELFKYILQTNPDFNPALLPQYIQEVQEDKAGLMSELLTAESETALSSRTLEYAKTVLDKKIEFQEKLKRYNEDVVSRTPHLDRHQNIVHNTGVLQAFGATPRSASACHQLLESTIRLQAADNTIKLSLECARIA